MQNVVDAAGLTSIYILFSLGLMLTWSVANILNLAHGAVYMMGAYVCYELTLHWALPFWALVPIAVLAGGLTAAIINALAFRPVFRRVSNLVTAERITLITSIGAGACIIGLVRHRLSNQAQA